MSAVTAGIDAIASTRVVINAPECNHTTTHSSGEQVMYVSAINKMLGLKIQASK